MDIATIESHYDSEVKQLTSLLNDLKSRRKKLEHSDTEQALRQIIFLTKLIDTYESMFALTQTIRTHYWAEVDKFLSAQIEYEKTRLLNDTLIKRMALMGEIRLKLKNIVE